MVKYFKANDDDCSRSRNGHRKLKNAKNYTEGNKCGRQFALILKHSKNPSKIMEKTCVDNRLFYEFNWVKLRKYMRKMGLYNAKPEEATRVQFPCYLEIISKPLNDVSIMHNLFCDFILSIFINIEWKTVYEPELLPPPPLVFTSVFTYSSEIRMPLTVDALNMLTSLLINDDDNHDNTDISWRSFKLKGKAGMPKLDLFNHFKTFLQMIIDYKTEKAVINSTILLIIQNLTLAQFTNSMDSFLTWNKIGAKYIYEGQGLFYMCTYKMKVFLNDKLKRQLHIQSKQLKIKESIARDNDCEYDDFTDWDKSPDEYLTDIDE
jgi:hypothetical protein